MGCVKEHPNTEAKSIKMIRSVFCVQPYEVHFHFNGH